MTKCKDLVKQNRELGKEERSLQRQEGLRLYTDLRRIIESSDVIGKAWALSSPRRFPLLSPLTSSGPGVEKGGSALSLALRGALKLTSASLGPIHRCVSYDAEITQLSHSWVSFLRLPRTIICSLWKVPACLSWYVYGQLRGSLSAEPSLASQITQWPRPRNSDVQRAWSTAWWYLCTAEGGLWVP